MPEGHDTIIEVSNIMSFVLYTQILKQSVLKAASPGITLIGKKKIRDILRYTFHIAIRYKFFMYCDISIYCDTPNVITRSQNSTVKVKEARMLQGLLLSHTMDFLLVL